MVCRWVPDKEIGRFWVPECWGGLNGGPGGCYCKREPKKSDLEKRVERLEKIVAHLCPDKSDDI